MNETLGAGMGPAVVLVEVRTAVADVTGRTVVEVTCPSVIEVACPAVPHPAAPRRQSVENIIAIPAAIPANMGRLIVASFPPCVCVPLRDCCVPRVAHNAA